MVHTCMDVFQCLLFPHVCGPKVLTVHLVPLRATFLGMLETVETNACLVGFVVARLREQSALTTLCGAFTAMML